MILHMRHTLWTGISETNVNFITSATRVHANIRTQQVQTPATVILDEPSCLLIDGQAHVMAPGNPPDISTFGEYANIFASTVFKTGARYQRIAVVFVMYQDESIKAGTRTKRKQGHRPVRRKIESNVSFMNRIEHLLNSRALYYLYSILIIPCINHLWCEAGLCYYVSEQCTCKFCGCVGLDKYHLLRCE